MTSEMQIDSYLTALRTHLGPLTIAEREEIVREINAHVRDSAEEAGASVESVLARLGPAEELAAQYRDGQLISQASRSLSPLVLLRATLRLATKGVFGFVAFFLGLFGYTMGVGLVLTALLKPIFPANTGFWVNDYRGFGFISAGSTFPSPPPHAHDILGIWYTPLALTLGSLSLLFTTMAIRKSLRTSRRWQSRM
jgi:uncharacterized membrane protein